MKKRSVFTLIAIFATLFLAFDANAQQNDVLLDKIEQANAAVKTRKGAFSEMRQAPGMVDTQELNGAIEYEAPATLTMDYSDKNEFFSIKDNTMVVKRGGKPRVFDLAKNKPMKTLSQLLLASFDGKLRELAGSVNSTLKVEESKDAIIATLEAKKKAVKGYAKVILEYDSKSFQLINMIMEEFDGTVTTYTMK